VQQAQVVVHGLVVTKSNAPLWHLDAPV